MSLRYEKANFYFAVLLLFGCLIVCSGLRAQKQIELVNYSTDEEKTHNFIGAEVYLIVGGKYFFVPKIARFKFQTNRRIDSLAAADKREQVDILIRNSKKDFVVQIPTIDFIKEGAFLVSIFKQHRKQYYSIVFSETHGTGFCNSQVQIRPNKLWRKKYSQCMFRSGFSLPDRRYEQYD